MAFAVVKKEEFNSEINDGLQILKYAILEKDDGRLFLQLKLKNVSNTDVGSFTINYLDDGDNRSKSFQMSVEKEAVFFDKNLILIGSPNITDIHIKNVIKRDISKEKVMYLITNISMMISLISFLLLNVLLFSPTIPILFNSLFLLPILAEISLMITSIIRFKKHANIKKIVLINFIIILITSVFCLMRFLIFNFEYCLAPYLEEKWGIHQLGLDCVCPSYILESLILILRGTCYYLCYNTIKAKPHRVAYYILFAISALLSAFILVIYLYPITQICH